MAEKTYAELEQLKRDLKAGTTLPGYLFYGEERYLQRYYQEELRRALVAEGTETFNHHRLEGASLTLSQLAEALDAMPAFSERTLVELRDWDPFSLPEQDRQALAALLSEQPPWVCLLLIYETVPFKPDKRLKFNGELLKRFSCVEFGRQEHGRVITWLMKRAGKLGAQLDRETAEYMTFHCGGLMTELDPELQKLCAYCDGVITKREVDQVTTPAVDAVAWQLTDALTNRRYGEAMETLGRLLELQEPAHKIIAAVSSELRRLLTVKLWLEEGRAPSELKELCGFRFDFQLRNAVTAARRVSLDWCTRGVTLCGEAALGLNSQKAEYEDLLRQLMAELALS